MTFIVDFFTFDDTKKDSVTKNLNDNFKKRTKELFLSDDPNIKEKLFSSFENDKKKVKDDLKKNLIEDLSEKNKRYIKNKGIKSYCDETIDIKLKEFDDLLTKEEEKIRKENEYKAEISK